MEGEGSGYDLIYELNSKDTKPFPIVESVYDYTKVIQSSKVLDQSVVYLLEYISKHYQLSQKEFIALGIIARAKKILSTELSKLLQLSEDIRLKSYINRLLERKILIKRGQKKGTQYLLNPELLKSSKLHIKASLKTMELHTLKALIVEDLKLYPKSQIRQIQSRIPDIDIKDLRKGLYELVKEGEILHSSDKTYRKYWLVKKNREK